MVRMLRSELFRLRKRPQTWVLALIMAGGVAALYAGLVIAAFALTDPASPREAIRPSSLFETGMQVATGLGFVLVAIAAASLAGNEYGWGTIRPLVYRAPSRVALLTAKLLALALVVIALLAVGFFTAVVSSIAGTLIVGEDLAIPAGLAGDWSVSLVRALVAQAPYAALTVLATLLSRSTAVGIGVGIGVGFLEPALWALAGLMTSAFDRVREFGLDHPSTLLFNMNAGIDDVTAADAGRAMAILIAWTALFVAASYAVFTRRDVTSG